MKAQRPSVTRSLRRCWADESRDPRRRRRGPRGGAHPAARRVVRRRDAARRARPGAVRPRDAAYRLALAGWHRDALRNARRAGIFPARCRGCVVGHEHPGEGVPQRRAGQGQAGSRGRRARVRRDAGDADHHSRPRRALRAPRWSSQPCARGRHRTRLVRRHGRRDASRYALTSGARRRHLHGRGRTA